MPPASPSSKSRSGPSSKSRSGPSSKSRSGSSPKSPSRAPSKTRATGRGSETEQLVLLDGLAVRRRRHDQGWSPRELVTAISEACFAASGLRRTLTPNKIQAIEERAERIPYDELLLLADGLACDPSDLIAEGEMSSAQAKRALH